MPETDSKYADISLVITACGRFDLLQQTVASMQPWVTRLPEKILIEDSGQRAPIHDELEKAGFIVLINKQKLGQHASMDKAYRHVTNPYIFYCEDDWEFYCEPDLNLAKILLDQGEASCFNLRQPDDRAHPKYPEQEIDDSIHQTKHFAGKDFLAIAEEHRHPKHGFMYNACIFRKELYDAIGPYSNYLTEREVATVVFEKTGLLTARQVGGCCFHIGWNRHMRDPYNLSPAYNLLQRLQRSWIKRFKNPAKLKRPPLD